MRRTIPARSGTGVLRQCFCALAAFSSAASIAFDGTHSRSAYTEPFTGLIERSTLLRGDVGGGEAAVDQELGSGDVRGFVGREEQRALGDLVRFAEAAHRDVYEPAFFLLLGIEEVHQQLGPERAGTKRVDAD